MDTVLNSIILLFWSAFFFATLYGLYLSFRNALREFKEGRKEKTISSTGSFQPE